MSSSVRRRFFLQAETMLAEMLFSFRHCQLRVWRRASLCRQGFRDVCGEGEDAQWHSLVSLQQCLYLQTFWR